MFFYRFFYSFPQFVNLANLQLRSLNYAPGRSLDPYRVSTPIGFSVHPPQRTPEKAQSGFESCTEASHASSGRITIA